MPYIDYVDIQMGDGLVCDAYVSLPKGVEPGVKVPAILFLMDGIGLRPRLEEMADTIAQQGYYVIAPNLFYRAARAPVVPDIQELLAQGPEGREKLITAIFKHIVTLTPDLFLPDVTKYIDYIDQQTDYVVSGAPIGVVGYCMGGTNAVRVACAHPTRVAALGCFHAANLVTDQPDSPHLQLGAIKGCRFHFGHADHDDFNTPQQIATLEKTLSDLHIDASSEVYKDAPHAYTMKDSAMYQKEGEEKHWVELESLLTKTFKSK
ncbi:hydrolase [Cavenderia fasciculata]|uniref:Hydrolase n=1 Tax=Cavenderia fasciculata TaxID=261658 RepID=F4PW30_CACFS|nr:hydrolase [Cavenderia fasciculata]EGG20194.1 hydrolase [Cavenderia fasciculata]|eukprot:XP_004367177.1 hydrolase [Cavenderia fasciculata]